jgi:hypothetical protein
MNVKIIKYLVYLALCVFGLFYMNQIAQTVRLLYVLEDFLNSEGEIIRTVRMLTILDVSLILFCIVKIELLVRKSTRQAK